MNMLILSAIFFGILLSFATTSASAKYNICTITLNSKEEIDLFKKNLNPNVFSFVELTDLASSKSEPEAVKGVLWPIEGWFNKVCELETNCDALIISSHQWEGKFFGEAKSSSFRLSADLLQEKKYQNSCGSFFKKIKQVYLFGCNTLTKNDGDYTSFESYLDYLAYDNHTENLSEQLPEAHTKFGRAPPSNFFIMRSIFSDTKKIFGFSKRSPVGKDLVPSLNKFFEQMSSAQFEMSLEKDTNNDDFNSVLLKQMSAHNMVATTGFNSDNKIELERIEFLNQMRSPRISFSEKLIILKNRLNADLEKNIDINTILNLIWPKDKTKMTTEQLNQVEFYRDNQKAFDAFNERIKKSKAFGEKLDLVYIGNYLGLYDFENTRELQKYILAQYLKPNMSKLDTEIVCNVMTFQRPLLLEPQELAIGANSSANYREAVKCVRFLDPQKRKMSSLRKKSKHLKLKLHKITD